MWEPRRVTIVWTFKAWLDLFTFTGWRCVISLRSEALNLVIYAYIYVYICNIYIYADRLLLNWTQQSLCWSGRGRKVEWISELRRGLICSEGMCNCWKIFECWFLYSFFFFLLLSERMGLCRIVLFESCFHCSVLLSLALSRSFSTSVSLHLFSRFFVHLLISFTCLYIHFLHSLFLFL
jgi:hypothetical protein